MLGENWNRKLHIYSIPNLYGCKIGGVIITSFQFCFGLGDSKEWNKGVDDCEKYSLGFYNPVIFIKNENTLKGKMKIYKIV